MRCRALSWPLQTPQPLLQTLCKGMKLCQSDTDRLAIVEAVRDVDTALLEGLPALEVQWLVATLWNRGCSHVKVGRPAQSVQLMKAALDLQAWLPAETAKQQVGQLPRSTLMQESASDALLGCA